MTDQPEENPVREAQIDLDDTRGLRERMERAVGGLHAPDVARRVIADARRHRTQQRIRYATGGVAAVAAVGAIAYPLTQGTGSPAEPGEGEDRQGVAPQPAGPTTIPSDDGCPERPAGWWDMPADQVRATLAGLLPAGVTVGTTDDATAGGWSGNLVESSDRDFAMVSLLPPPAEGGRPEPRENDGSIVFCGTREPLQKVEACDPGEACEEIRDDTGALVGVVRERVESTIENGADLPTDKSYLMATLVGPGGGHVDIYVAEGTRADRPGTVHDPADRPALTLDQVRDLVTDPAWTGHAP